MIGTGRGRPGRGLAGAVLLGLLLGACTQGDLGRPRTTVWDQIIAPQSGFASATARGEAASYFRLTDDEEQLRYRAFRFVAPAYPRTAFDTQLAELVQLRILPVQAQSVAVSDYFAGLTGSSFASQSSRYNRLSEDANADRLLIGPFRANAMRVVVMDRVRMRVAEGSPLVPEVKQEPAFARVVENEGLILWVCERVHFRIESYRYALANLVVEMPSREAVRAERAIMALEAEAGPLCKLPLVGAFEDGKPAERRPVVYKG